MSSDTPKKPPNKEALLGELESIRDFLTEGEQDDEITIPTLTVVAEDNQGTVEEQSEAPNNIDQTPIELNTLEDSELNSEDNGHKSQDHIEQTVEAALLNTYHPEPDKTEHNDTFDLEDEQASTDTSIKEVTSIDDDSEIHTDTPQSLPPSAPEHIQNALFEENHSDEEPQVAPFTKAHALEAKKIRDQLSGASNERELMPKARGENPFLPPHIRERLGKHKELFESVPEDLSGNHPGEIQGDLLTGFSQSKYDTTSASTESELTPLDQEREALIDELVSEFMPKIEERLRAKLRATTWNNDE